MGLFKTKTKQPKLIIHEHTFDEYDNIKKQKESTSKTDSKPQQKESYEDYLIKTGDLEIIKTIDEKEYLKRKYQDDDFPQFKIDSYDYNLNYEKYKPQEISFDEIYDVNEDFYYTKPTSLIKSELKSQSKIQALIAAAEVLKPKFLSDDK